MRSPPTTTNTSINTTKNLTFEEDAAISCLLVAYAKPGNTAVDRCKLSPIFIIGRSAGADFVLNDSRVSKHHARITEATDGFWIADLGSTNGTFVNGYRLTDEKRLLSNDVIRIGSTLLVYCENSDALLEPFPLDRLNITGDFHAGPIVRELTAAARSNLHILITGPSGAGKELVATGLSSLLLKSSPNAPFIVHNAARFTSDEEATTTLFGVGVKVFSNVAARTGLIERAAGGVLFLDEVHNLPDQVQRTLLRIIEDGKFSRIGDSKEKRVALRFVLATNVPPPTFGLAHDLLARLRILRIPPLKERVADIPSIFDVVMKKALQTQNIDYAIVKEALRTDHYETLCLDGFENENVRGMIVLADKVATFIATGMSPKKAVAKVFIERFQDGPVVRRAKENTPLSELAGADRDEAQSQLSAFSHYELHKAAIIEVFKQARGNVAATARILNEKGIKCSRRWLDIYLDKWEVRRRRYRHNA